jgi:serine/threonine protein kinase
MKQCTAPDTAGQSEAAQFQPPGIEEISRLFPQLEILSLIGKGGAGAVYRARLPALNRIVALKILPPRVATGSNFVERFNSEARALARLNHPDIVAVYEFGQAGGLPYFIMEWP